MSTQQDPRASVKLMPLIAWSIIIVVVVTLLVIWFSTPTYESRSMDGCLVTDIGGSRGSSVVQSSCGDFANTGGLMFELDRRYDLVVKSTRMGEQFVASATLSADQ